MFSFSVGILRVLAMVIPAIQRDGPGRLERGLVSSDALGRVTRCDVTWRLGLRARLIIPPPRSPPRDRTCQPACRISGPRRPDIRIRVARRPYLGLEKNERMRTSVFHRCLDPFLYFEFFN